MSHEEIILHVKSLIINLEPIGFDYNKDDSYSWHTIGEDEIKFKDESELLFVVTNCVRVVTYAEDEGIMFDVVSRDEEVQNLVYITPEGEEIELTIEKELTNLLLTKVYFN